MPEDETAQPARVEFEAFYRHRWTELRLTFGAATFLGIDPDDIVQETMLIAREHYARFASDDELALWCKRVGLNLIRREARTAYRRRESPDASPLDAGNASPDLTAGDAEDAAVENVELARVLSSLPQRHSDVLMLDAAGRTREEVAAILQITPEAARKLLARARDAARKSWGKVVAAVLVLVACFRKNRMSQSGNSHPLLASVVSVSVAAMLVVHNTGQAGTEDRKSAHAATSVVGGAAAVPRVEKTSSRPFALTARRAHGTAHLRAWSNPSTSTLLPRVPRTCAPHVCVGPACPNQKQTGDRIYVTPAGYPCLANVTESVVPVCEYVPAGNPLLGCQRNGNPQWLVNPPPTPSPKGEPL